MQGTWVPSLVWEDSTSCRASKPMCHNWIRMLQYWSPCTRAPVPCTKRSQLTEKPAHAPREQPLTQCNWRKPTHSHRAAKEREQTKDWEAAEFTKAKKVTPILIFAWKFWSYHWQQILSVIFLEATSIISFIPKKMSAKYPDLNNQLICQSLFQVKMMFHEKGG